MLGCRNFNKEELIKFADHVARIILNNEFEPLPKRMSFVAFVYPDDEGDDFLSAIHLTKQMLDAAKVGDKNKIASIIVESLENSSPKLFIFERPDAFWIDDDKHFLEGDLSDMIDARRVDAYRAAGVRI